MVSESNTNLAQYLAELAVSNPQQITQVLTETIQQLLRMMIIKELKSLEKELGVSLLQLDEPKDSSHEH